jgi:hypothetical protein
MLDWFRPYSLTFGSLLPSVKASFPLLLTALVLSHSGPWFLQWHPPSQLPFSSTSLFKLLREPSVQADHWPYTFNLQASNTHVLDPAFSLFSFLSPGVESGFLTSTPTSFVGTFASLKVGVIGGASAECHKEKWKHSRAMRGNAGDGGGKVTRIFFIPTLKATSSYSCQERRVTPQKTRFWVSGLMWIPLLPLLVKNMSSFFHTYLKKTQ